MPENQNTFVYEWVCVPEYDVGADLWTTIWVCVPRWVCVPEYDVGQICEPRYEYAVTGVRHAAACSYRIGCRHDIFGAAGDTQNHGVSGVSEYAIVWFQYVYQELVGFECKFIKWDFFVLMICYSL